MRCCSRPTDTRRSHWSREPGAGARTGLADPGAGFPSGRGRSLSELRQVGARENPLLAVQLQDGLALDRAGVGRQPLLPDDGSGRGHPVGADALDDDVVTRRTVEDVLTGAAQEDVVAGAAEQCVVARAAEQHVVALAAVER